MKQLTDEMIEEVMASMEGAESPDTLYYWKPSIIRHPMKRLKQIYKVWKLNRKGRRL